MGAAENCAKRCNLCNAQVTVNPNIGVVTRSGASGCYYNGKVYNQGDNWLDGCQYNCTCENGVTGFYRCIERCPTYSFIPQGCSLQKTPGECCQKLVCPQAGGGTVTNTTSGCQNKNKLYTQG